MSGYLQAVRAEVRKLFSVRSTYYVLLLMLALDLLFAFLIFGYKISAADRAADGPGYLVDVITNGVMFLSVFPAFVCTLLVTHEYRHNTILYALTSSPSRLRVLLAKVTVATLYSVGIAAVFALLSLGLALLGNTLAGHQLVAQSLPASLVWQVLFYGWATAMIGLLLGTLFRNQVVAIVSLLVIPNVLEQILGLLLKQNSVYMPYTALAQVIGAPNGNPALDRGHLTAGQGALVALAYLAVGWAVAVTLFVRRDAS